MNVVVGVSVIHCNIMNVVVRSVQCNVQKCPFEAITIINLPSNLEKDTTHRYSANSFKLHRLPTPRPGEVLGLVGTNGIGKSTALKILAGKQKPNLGRFKVRVISWEPIALLDNINFEYLVSVRTTKCSNAFLSYAILWPCTVMSVVLYFFGGNITAHYGHAFMNNERNNKVYSFLVY